MLRWWLRAERYLFPLYLVMIGSLFVGLGILWLPKGDVDDSYITFYVARHLAETGEIANYNGERVEQSSTLLFVLVLAGVYKLTQIEVEWWGKVLPVLFGVATLFLFAYFLRRTSRILGWWLPLLIATHIPFLMWSYSGMETTLTAFCLGSLVLVSGSLLSQTRPRWDWLLLGIVALATSLVRPEMPLVLLALSSGMVIFWGATSWYARELKTVAWRVIGGWWGCLTVASLSVLLFRKLTFGTFFPQPVVAKSMAFAVEEIRAGFIYFFYYLASPNDPLRIFVILLVLTSYLVLLLHLLRKKTPPPPVLLSMAIIFVYVSYVVLSGGDWMEYSRFVVPLVGFFMVVVSYPITVMFRSLWLQHLLLGGVLLLQVPMLLHIMQPTNPDYLPNREQEVAQFTVFDSARFTWFAIANHQSRAEIPVIYHMDWLLQRVPPEARPLTLVTSQSGVVLYHTVTRHPHTLYIMDFNSLLHNRYTSCAALQPYLGHNDFGTGFTQDYLSLPLAECDIPAPDIYYNIDWLYGKETIAYYEAQGYRLFYLQLPPPHLPDIPSSVILVREEIAAQIPDFQYFEVHLADYFPPLE